MSEIKKSEPNPEPEKLEDTDWELSPEAIAVVQKLRLTIPQENVTVLEQCDLIGQLSEDDSVKAIPMEKGISNVSKVLIYDNPQAWSKDRVSKRKVVYDFVLEPLGGVGIGKEHLESREFTDSQVLEALGRYAQNRAKQGLVTDIRLMIEDMLELSRPERFKMLEGKKAKDGPKPDDVRYIKIMITPDIAKAFEAGVAHIAEVFNARQGERHVWGNTRVIQCLESIMNNTGEAELYKLFDAAMDGEVSALLKNVKPRARKVQEETEDPNADPAVQPLALGETAPTPQTAPQGLTDEDMPILRAIDKGDSRRSICSEFSIGNPRYTRIRSFMTVAGWTAPGDW